jgi:hypothetical protein
VPTGSVDGPLDDDDLAQILLLKVRRMVGENKGQHNGSIVIIPNPTDEFPDLELLPKGRQTYMLLSAGPDAAFFPDTPLYRSGALITDITSGMNSAEKKKVLDAYRTNDDITNFRGAGQ